MKVLGQVVSGGFGRILIRQKADQKIEVGELLIAETDKGKMLMQAFDLVYGSQLTQQSLELVSGMKLEEENDLELMDTALRNYTLASLKSLVTIEGNQAKTSKTLPGFFSQVREVKKEDLTFLTKPKNPLPVGKLRSGSKTLDVDIFLQGEKVFSHHILIPAQTGRGKSNLTSCMLWNAVDEEYCGILVLDPHDEYYGRNKPGLSSHQSKDKIVYYTPKSPPPGSRSLKINIENIRPSHFNGVVSWSDPQKEALNAFYKKYKKSWIEAILLEQEIEGFQEGTLGVIKRRLLALLDLQTSGQEIFCNGIFDTQAGASTISDMTDELEKSNTVIIDTSSFSGSVELLIGSLVASEVLNKYRHYKTDGTLDNKPVISIVLEEAPRVIGKEALERGPNIFSTIAREGRKFKVGLTAITQLPSLIPRDILANMSTKIILGIEMAPERQAIIESAAQDLSEDSRNIASLDTGEAIITSNFTRFATPVKIPLFTDLIDNNNQPVKKDFSGLR
ncbi:MAG: ATP-binding protein [bacterium]|nr:ATP-binding protein [bacterium]